MTVEYKHVGKDAPAGYSDTKRRHTGEYEGLLVAMAEHPGEWFTISKPARARVYVSVARRANTLELGWERLKTPDGSSEAYRFISPEV